MGNLLYDEIPQSLFEWIKKQNMFFVATAPLINSKQVWYEDLSGSGVETISHIRENGRITIMFCAFEGPPRILRLSGIGSVHEYGSAEYNKLVLATSRKLGSRSAIVIDVYHVGISCGYGVPLYDFVMHRTQLLRISDTTESKDRAVAASHNLQQGQDLPNCYADKCDDGDDKKWTSRKYWIARNTSSPDGQPGLLTTPDTVLEMTPQSNFDRDCARPTLRRIGCDKNIVGDRKWFASGFALGAVAVLALTRAVEHLE